MPKLDKGTLALTFKFDCDRFLRFRLATDAERDALGVESDTYKRPGIELIKAAGRRWEADKYQDLVDVASAGTVAHVLKDEIDPLVGRQLFGKVTDLFTILRQPTTPSYFVEAEFEVPSNITPALQQAYDNYGLEPVRVRPDILWVRPSGTGAPLIGDPDPVPEYEIHVVDVKMAAEPSLRHFTEVTYYALALAAALVEQGLSDRYAVSAEGFIWPGSHDVNAFRNLVNDLQARGEPDPVTEALLDTFVPVPYEVYQVHVKQFFEERLLKVLGQQPDEASWHVGPKCQLCDYVRYCRQEAENCDHLSRLPWLNQGQAELLREHGIATTQALRDAIRGNTEEWLAAEASSHQLRADAPALAVRAEALHSNQPVAINGRRCALMPAWSNQNIFITIHFDPGFGITFALGAARVYFPPGRNQGDPPETEEQVFVVDRVDAMNPETERARLMTILLTPFVPCIAQTTTTVILAPIFFGALAPLVVVGLILFNIVVLGLSGILLNRVLPNREHLELIMELPLYQWPNPRTIGIYVWQRMKHFLAKAGTVIVAATVVIWALSYFPHGNIETSILASIGRFLTPLGELMGLNWITWLYYP